MVSTLALVPLTKIPTLGRNAGGGLPSSAHDADRGHSPSGQRRRPFPAHPTAPTLSRHAIASPGGGRVAGGARGPSHPDRRGAGRPSAPPARGAAPGPAHGADLVDLQHRLLPRRRPGLPPLGHDPV